MNERGEVLVGCRVHPPARGSLFVPGGRILKGETMAEALKRVAKQETGLDLSPGQVTLHGIYDHIYADSFLDDSSISTQYVVIACRCAVATNAAILSDEQHESFHFLPIARLLADPGVHPNTKAYFLSHPENLFLGGEAAARRQ